MNPPTEQLVRDYLNRVSVAAKGRLGADDRRAFLARTREFIELNTRAVGQTDSAEVLKLLAGLGDPAALVARERDRLAARRAEPGTGDPAGGSRPTRAWHWRPAKGTLANLMTSPATAVPPGQDVSIPEPAEDAPMTGEIRFQTRPISARWRPGGTLEPKPPRPRRAGIPRRLQRGDRQLENEQQHPGTASTPSAEAAVEPSAEAAVDQPGAASPPPLPADAVGRPRRPQWPSLGASGLEAEGPVQPNVPSPGGEPEHSGAEARPNGESPSGPQLNGSQPDPAQPGSAQPGSAEPGSAEPSGAQPSSAAQSNGTQPSSAAQSNAAQSNGAQSSGAELNGAEPNGRPASWVKPSGRHHSERRPSGTRPNVAEGGAVYASGPDASEPPGPAAKPGAGEPAGPPPSDLPPIDLPGGESHDAEPLAGGAPGGELPDGGLQDDDVQATDVSDDDVPGRVVPASAVPASAVPDEGVAPGRKTRVPGALPRVVRGAGWASGVRARGVRAAGRGSGWASGVRARNARASQPGATGPGSQQEGSPGEEPLGSPSLGLGLPPGSLATIGGGARRLARTVAIRARRRPLEATAVVLLGLGGLIFPPVWLMGAVMALISRVWDHRDKWIGLALPLVLVVAATVADVLLGATRHSLGGYVREAWLFAGHFCRIVAVLGAIYLAWRAERGRRSPAIPPWNKPRRFG